MNHSRHALRFAALVPLIVFAGCASSGARDSKAAEAPKSAPVDPAIAPLAFLTGTWTLSQPNGALIEEAWGRPRGKSVLGSFRRVLGNGATPFYEFTQIVSDAQGVLLRQIHVHGNFDPDPKRTAPMVLKLDKLDAKSASFTPLDDPNQSHAGSLARVTYTRVDAQTLLLVVEPKTDSADATQQAPLEFRMTLQR